MPNLITEAARSVTSGLKLFLVNSVVQFSLISAEWVDSYGWTTDGPVEDFWPTAAAMIVIYPSVFTVLLLMVLFVLGPTRGFAKSLLLSPVSLTIFGVFGVGLLVTYPLGQTTLGWSIGWASCLLAAITQFQVEDRGPQPWLGLFFLLAGYAIGSYVSVTAVAADTDGEYALPDSVAGWTVAVVSLALIVAAGVRLWRKPRPSPAG